MLDTGFNPYPAEPGYTLSLQSKDPDQLEPTVLDLHCLSLSV